MITGTTKSGFSFAVSEDIGSDFRIMEAIADAESEDASEKLRGTVNLVRAVLGNSGKRALYRHVMKDGVVPSEAVAEEITEILQIAKEKQRTVKN